MKDERYVTLDWARRPITTKGDGYILPRDAEMIINAKYHPTGTLGEWPVDSDMGEKLQMEPSNKDQMIPINSKSKTQRTLIIVALWVAAILMLTLLIGLIFLDVAKDIAIWKWFLNN